LNTLLYLNVEAINSSFCYYIPENVYKSAQRSVLFSFQQEVGKRQDGLYVQVSIFLCVFDAPITNVSSISKEEICVRR
jgi:hypothetical protein